MKACCTFAFLAGIALALFVTVRQAAPPDDGRAPHERARLTSVSFR
jgi:hypothetical protein